MGNQASSAAINVASETVLTRERSMGERVIRAASHAHPVTSVAETASNIAEMAVVKHQRDIESHRSHRDDFMKNGASKRDADIHAAWMNGTISSSSAATMLNK